MKIKTIKTEVRLVKNYQGYGITMTAELEDGEDPESVTKELAARCRKEAMYQRDL